MLTEMGATISGSELLGALRMAEMDIALTSVLNVRDVSFPLLHPNDRGDPWLCTLSGEKGAATVIESPFFWRLLPGR
jgi:hypothetical protein